MLIDKVTTRRQGNNHEIRRIGTTKASTKSGKPNLFSFVEFQ